MKPVQQTLFGAPHGNCFAACLASIFETTIEEVPRFRSEDPAGDDRWWPDIIRWCRARGMTIVLYPNESFTEWPIVPIGYYVASGPAARGLQHSCVYRSGKLCWDPHPDATGLNSIEDLMLFIPLYQGSL